MDKSGAFLYECTHPRVGEEGIVSPLALYIPRCSFPHQRVCTGFSVEVDNLGMGEHNTVTASD